MDVLRIGEASENVIWIIARQHPGETMAEWFIEGLLSRLLDEEDPTAQNLLQYATFYVVPNMNPDGAIAGNLRTNAKGANLNREWAEPSAERSPEVLAIKKMMQETGCDLFLDVHGDEAIPYNFVAGGEGIPSYNEKIAKLEEKFKQAFLAASKDFQVEHGYPKDAPGQANLTIASTAIGELFQCLAFTIEMPFKDNDNLPNEELGWTSNRSFTFGRDCLFPVAQVIHELKG